MSTFRDYTFLGTTQSLCPDCLTVVPAKIVSRAGRVYFRKTCAAHGPREDFVCSDVKWFDRNGYSLPGKVPLSYGAEVKQGCPYDCGLCSEHEQHTCIGLLEITSSCNLECPMCFAVSGPGGKHLTLEQCRAAIDRLVEVEGQPEILQLSGGEPTIHPDFHEIHQYACDQPIDIVMINTNGVRLAKDAKFLERVALLKHRTEIYLQFDGFSDAGYEVLRGESLLETKLKAVEELGRVGLNTILVCTVQPGVNDHELGRIVEFGMQRPWVTGVSFQPATYSGRFVLPEQLEQRITFPDIIRGVAEQTSGVWRETDFSPLPCAHPNAHTLAYAFRSGDQMLPLARFVDLENHLDLLSGRITFNRQRAQELIVEYLSRQACGAGGCSAVSPESRVESPEKVPGPRERMAGEYAELLGQTAAESLSDDAAIAQQFFLKAVTQQLNPSDMFRITTTSFMDAWNFDIRQLMKSCVHFVLPTGHLIPFSAYNVLYRNGHVPLPPLQSVETVSC
jgi:uncharacterized radical SAM superfamily Fe-S cluster-containing enzyme